MAALEELKEKLAKREIIFGSTFATVNNIYFPKLFKNAGVDYMLFDCEHGIFNPEIANDMLMAARACDLPTIVRVQDCEYHCISKCLDMGADGILIPRTETLEQVELAIDSMRIPPRGHKGSGGDGFKRPGETYDQFNENRLLILQMESPLGIRNLPEILTKYGDEVAAVLIGPADMSAFSGAKDNLRSDVTEANIKKVVEICHQFKKSVGMMMGPQAIEMRVAQGMNLLWCAKDTVFMQKGVKDTLKVVEKLRAERAKAEA